LATKPYETVVVVDAMIPDESIASEFDAIAKLIETQGKLVKLDRWGKRRLAYSIRKRTHAEYAVFYYESAAALPAELEKRFRINENILRFLTIADNPVGVPADKPMGAEGEVLEPVGGGAGSRGRDRDDMGGGRRDRDDMGGGRRDDRRDD
jgi:small subunit ribosomal protein S6